MFEDEFKIYDSVTANSIEIGDQIVYENEHVEVHSVLDDGILIEIAGYSYEQDEPVEEIKIDPDVKVDLWMIA